MKKVLAILLVAALMVSSSVAVMAAGDYSVETPVTVQVKNASGTYDTTVSVKTGETVDLQATVDMSKVQTKIDQAMDLAQTYCDSRFTKGTYAAVNAMNAIKNAVVGGTLTLKLTYPSAIELPSSVVNGTGMQGFNDGAKNIFTEVKRSVKIESTTATLTIEVKVKDNLTLGTLAKNAETYLKNMTFTATGLVAKSACDANVTGALKGEVASKGDTQNYTNDTKFTIDGTKNAKVTATVGKYTVSGKVVDKDNQPVSGATVKLNGTTATTDATGAYTFADIVNGTYSLEVSKDGESKTVSVTVSLADRSVENVTMQGKKVSTVVEDNTSSTGDSVLNNADAITDAIVGGSVTDDTTGISESVNDVVDNGGSVEIKHTFEDIVSKIQTIVDDIKEKVKEEIKETKSKVESLAGVKTEVIVKGSDGSTKATETKTEVTDNNNNKKTMHFSFPFSTSKKKSFALVSVDDSEATNPTINAGYTQVDSIDKLTAGTFYVDEVNDVIHVGTTEATAEFAVAYDDAADITVDNPNANENAPYENTDESIQQGGTSGYGGYYVPSNDDDTTTITSWPFTDVNAGDWFYQGVAYAYSNGLFKGATATTFEPETALTRGMLVTVLGRYDGVSDTSAFTNTFADVADGEYYAAHIAWAADNKIVTGYGDGNFGPNDIITREQMATIMYRYMQYKGLAKDEDLSAALTYADASAIADYAVDGVKYCYLKGIMSGKEGNTFDPIGSATRAEFATVMMRTFQ